MDRPHNISLAARIFQTAHVRGLFTLRSGLLADEYFDKYRFEADPQLLRDVSEALCELLPDGAQAVAGLELGGVPLATMVSALSGLPARFVRKHAKPYGTCLLSEGGEVEHLRLVVIEDVVSTGGQLIDSCQALREEGANILSVVCVIDRGLGADANLAAHGLKLRALFSADELKAAASAS